MNGDTHSDTGQDWNPAVAQDPGEFVVPTVLGGIFELPENIAKAFSVNEGKDRPYLTKEMLGGVATITLIIALVAFCLLSGRGCSAGYG